MYTDLYNSDLGEQALFKSLSKITFIEDQWSNNIIKMNILQHINNNSGRNSVIAWYATETLLQPISGGGRRL